MREIHFEKYRVTYQGNTREYHTFNSIEAANLYGEDWADALNKKNISILNGTMISLLVSNVEKSVKKRIKIIINRDSATGDYYSSANETKKQNLAGGLGWR